MALKLLRARLFEVETSRIKNAQDASRKSQVGTGDRSEKIRTYNYPDSRVTDHRIKLTLYKLADIMNGNMDDLIQPLLAEHQADQLAELAK
jgi:peptide chain release factor 1